MKKSDRILALKFSELYENEKNLYRNAFDKNDIILWELTKSHDSTEEAKRDKTSMVIVRNRTLDSLDAPDTYDLYKVTLSHDNAVVLGNEHIKTSGLVEAMQSAARYLSGDETMLEMDDEEWEIVGPNNKRIDLGTGGKIWNSDKVYGYDSDRDVWVTTVNVDGKSVPVEIDNYFSFGKEDEFLGTGEWTSAIKLNGVEFNIVSFQHEDPDTEDAFGIRVRSHRNLDQDIPFSRIDSLEGEKFREYNAVKTFEIREIKGKSIFARRAMLWQGIGELIGENLGIRAEITDKNPNISVIKKQQESLIQDPNVLCEKIKDTEGIALNPGIASDVLEYAFRNNEETGSSRVLSFDGEKLYDYDAAEYKTLEEAKKENHAFETSSEKILEDAIIHISEVIAPAYPDNDYSGLIAELEEEKENIRKIKIMNEFFGRNYKNIGDVLVKDKEYWGEPHQELSEKERKELAIKTMAAEDFQTALIKNKSLPKELRNEDYTENELHTEFMDELLSGKYKTLEEAMKAFAEEWKKENSPRLTPNGKESSLSKEDYEYAHSDEFRERFGDWEKAYRLEKLKDAEPISVEGNLVVDEIDLTEELPKLQSEKMRGFLQYTMQTLTNKFVGQSFHNEDKNINIKFNRRSVREIQRHDYYFLQHIEAIPYVPQIIGKAIYIGSQKNNDRLKHPEIKEYMYFATGIKIRGEDYTCKSAVSVDNENNYYYDQTLSTIEKGKLVDEIKKLGNLSQLLTLWETEPNESIASHNPYDIRLLDICQCPQMKFLGENFEPTKEIISKIRSGKTIRDFAEQSANQRIEENGIYFEENVYRDWSRKEKRTFDDAVKFIKKEVQRANTYQIESVISELLRKTDLAKRIDEPDWDANSLAEEISASPYEKKILIAICDNNNTEIRKPLLLTTDAAYHFVTPEMFMDYYNRHKTESAKELSLSDAELLIRGYENGGDKSRLIIENDTLLQAEKTAEFFSKYRIRKISINKTFGRAIENYREKLGELLKDPDRTEQHSELQKDLKEKIQTLIAQQRTLLADVSDYHKLDSEKIIQKNDLKEGFKTTTQGAPSNKSRLIIAQHLDKVKNCDIEFTENFEPTSAEVDKAMETLDERKKNTLTPKEFAEFLNKANTNKSMKEVSESEAKLILDWNFPLDNRLEIRADGLYEKNIEGNTYKKEPEWIIKNAVESMKNQIAENKLQQASVEPDAYSADEANLAALKEIEHEFVGKDQFLTNSGIKGTFISIDDGMLGLYTEIWLELPEGHPALGDKEWTDKTKEYSRQSFDFATYADFKSDLSFDKLGEVTIRDHDEGINWPLAKPDSEYFSSKEKAEIIEEAKERFYQEVEKSLETFRTQMDFNGENISSLNEAMDGKLKLEPTKENIEILDNMLHSFESGGENLYMLKTDGFKKPGKIIVRKNEWMQDEEIENKPKTATERWENTYTIAYDLSGEEYGVFGTLDPEEFFSLALDSKFVKEKDVISGWLTEYQKNSYVEKINTFFKDTLEKLGRQPFENFDEIVKWDEEQYGKYDGAESEKEIIKKSAVAATATLLQEAINRDDMGLVPETIKNENYVESTLPKETAQLILYDAYRTLEDAIKSQFVQTEKEFEGLYKETAELFKDTLQTLENEYGVRSVDDDSGKSWEKFEKDHPEQAKAIVETLDKFVESYRKNPLDDELDKQFDYETKSRLVAFMHDIAEYGFTFGKNEWHLTDNPFTSMASMVYEWHNVDYSTMLGDYEKYLSETYADTKAENLPQSIKTQLNRIYTGWKEEEDERVDDKAEADAIKRIEERWINREEPDKAKSEEKQHQQEHNLSGKADEIAYEKSKLRESPGKEQGHKVFVGKHIEGITLNPLEYLLDDSGNEMAFDSEDEAKEFLRKKGMSDEEMEYLVFEHEENKRDKEMFRNNVNELSELESLNRTWNTNFKTLGEFERYQSLLTDGGAISDEPISSICDHIDRENCEEIEVLLEMRNKGEVTIDKEGIRKIIMYALTRDASNTFRAVFDNIGEEERKVETVKGIVGLAKEMFEKAYDLDYSCFDPKDAEILKPLFDYYIEENKRDKETFRNNVNELSELESLNKTWNTNFGTLGEFEHYQSLLTDGGGISQEPVYSICDHIDNENTDTIKELLDMRKRGDVKIDSEGIKKIMLYVLTRDASNSFYAVFNNISEAERKEAMKENLQHSINEFWKDKVKEDLGYGYGRPQQFALDDILDEADKLGIEYKLPKELKNFNAEIRKGNLTIQEMDEVKPKPAVVYSTEEKNVARLGPHEGLCLAMLEQQKDGEPHISFEQANAILKYTSYEDFVIYKDRRGRLCVYDASEDFDGEGTVHDVSDIVGLAKDMFEKAYDLEYSCFDPKDAELLKPLFDYYIEKDKYPSKVYEDLEKYKSEDINLMNTEYAADIDRVKFFLDKKLGIITEEYYSRGKNGLEEFVRLKINVSDFEKIARRFANNRDMDVYSELEINNVECKYISAGDFEFSKTAKKFHEDAPLAEFSGFNDRKGMAKAFSDLLKETGVFVRGISDEAEKDVEISQKNLALVDEYTADLDRVKFFVDNKNKTVLQQYYNPDATSGGQIVEVLSTFDELKEAVKILSDRADFEHFDTELEGLAAPCELTDVYREDFAEKMRNFHDTEGDMEMSIYDDAWTRRECLNVLLQQCDLEKELESELVKLREINQTEKENLKKNITARKDIGKIVLDHLLRSDDERIKGWIQQYIVETTMGNESQREDFEDYLREAETIDPDNLSEEQIKELLQKNVEEQDAEWLRDRLADLSDLDRHGFEADRVAESLSEIIPDPEYLRVFINGINAKEGHILDANLIEKVQELNIKDVEKRIKENQNDKVKFKVNHEEKTIEHWYFDDEETVEIPSVTVMKNSFDDFAKAMKEGDPYATLDVLASLSQDVTTVKQSEPGYLNRLQEYEKEEGDCPEFIYRSGNADEMKLAIQRVAEIAGIRTPETDRALLDGYTEKIASFLGRNEDDVRKDIGDFIADRDWSESEGPKDHAVQYLAGELRLELGGQANDRDTNCDLLNEAEACAYEVLDMERFSKSGTLRHLRNYAEFKGIMDVDKGLVRFSMDAENEKITHIYYSGGSLVKVENSADDLAAVLKDDPQGLRFIRNLRKIGEITTVQKGTPEYDELEKVYESVPISDFRQSQEFLDDYDGAGKREYINNLAELTEIVSLNLGENANSDTKFTLERFAKKHLDPSEDAINREIFFVMKEKRMIRQMYFDPHGKDGGKIFVNDCSFAMLADEAVKAKKSGRKFSHALTDTWNGTLKKYCSKGTADYILQKEVLEDKSILVDGDTSERLVADETMYRTSGQRRTEEVLENLLGRAEGVLNALAEEKGVDVPDGKTLPEIVQMAVEGDSDLFEIWKEKEYVSRARKYLADGDKNEKICSADVQFCSENEIGITVYPNTDSGGFEDLMGMKMEDWQNSHGIDDDAFDDRIDCCMNPDGNRAIYRVPDGNGGYAEKNVTDKVFKSGSPYLSAIAKELAEKYIPGQKAMHDKTLSDIKEIVDKAYQSNQKDYNGMHNEWSIKKDSYMNFTLKHQGRPMFAVRDNDLYIDDDKLRTLEVSAKSVLKTVRDVLYEKEDVMTPRCGMTETEYGPIEDKNPEFGDVKTLIASELKARAVSATHSANLEGLGKKKFIQPRSRSDDDRRGL